MTESKANSSASASDSFAMSTSKHNDESSAALRIRLDGLEKRVSDASTYVGWAFGSVALLLSAITIVSGLKYSSEIDRLNEFKKEVEGRLQDKVDSYIGHLQDRSELILLPTGREAFDGRPVSAQLIDEGRGIALYLQIKNVGETSGNITFLKLYTTDDIPLEELHRGSDIPEFSYSRAYPLNSIHIRNLPPTASAQYKFSARLSESFQGEQLIGKEFNVMVSVYYGESSKHQREVKILFEE